jgi:hypothetical protein
MSSSSTPDNQDLGLGGQNSPPSDSAILGGIEELQQQMNDAPPDQRSQLLASALNYGEAGIDLLIDRLTHDSVLAIRALAYQLLQGVDSQKANLAVADGVWLNAGDLIYGVYKSAIGYDDEYFFLFDSWDSESIDDTNWSDFGYTDYEAFCRDENDNYGGDLESYIPKRVARYVSKAQADAAAEQLHIKLVCEWDGGTYSFETGHAVDLADWCSVNQVLNAATTTDLDDLCDQLKAAGNYQLLGQLWRDSVGNFTFVREETVSESHYLKL